MGTIATHTTPARTLVINELRSDYRGQPRDKFGRFASSKGGQSTLERIPKPSKKQVGNFGKGAAVGAAIGGGFVAGQVLQQQKSPGGTADKKQEHQTPKDLNSEQNSNLENSIEDPETRVTEASSDNPAAEPLPEIDRRAELVGHFRSKLNPPYEKPDELESWENRHPNRKHRTLAESVPGMANVTQSAAETIESSENLPEPERRRKIVEFLRGRNIPRRQTKDGFDVILEEVRADYNPNQPRDKRGRWTKSKTNTGRLMSAVGSSSGGDSKFEELTIRDLKRVASEEGVVGYSNMTKKELVNSIKLSQSDPKFKKKAEKTLAKDRKRKALVNELAKQTPQGRFLKQWQKINKMTKAAGVAPAIAGAAITAFLVGQSVSAFRKDKAKYMSHSTESAAAASDRAASIAVEETDKPNLVFAVGGYKGMGSTAKKISEELTNKESQDGEWFEENCHITEVENETFDVNPLMPAKLPGGIDNPAYLGEVMAKHGGQVLKQKLSSRNATSVELAAQIYSQAIARDEKGNRINGDKPIQLITHGIAGGATVDEALLILKSMKLKNAESGDSILKRVNVTKLGSSSMRLADPPTTKPGELTQKTFTSPNDPFNILPKDNEFWKSDIKGGGISDYMGAESVRTDLKLSMGGDSSTYYYNEKVPSTKREARKRQASVDDLENKTNEELRDIAKNLGVKYKNQNKEQLKEEISKKRKSEKEKEKSSTSQQGSKAPTSKASSTSEGDRSAPEGDDTKKAPNKSPLMRKKRAELAEQAESMGVSTSGLTKAQIIEAMRSGRRPKQDSLSWVINSLQEV